MEDTGCPKSTTAALFAAQHAVLHRRRALAAGLTAPKIKWLVRKGAWVTVHRGVYRLAGVRPTWRMRLMAACLAAGPTAVASHRAAGALAWRLVAAGLSEPVRQYELWHEGELVARFDLAWPEARIAVELQSCRHHFGRRAWRRDAGRANGAAAQGWRVFMATEEDLREGRRTLAPELVRARAA